MAVIYTFPTKGTPVGADLVLLSDSEDDNNTKNATIASMVASNAIDVVDTVTASGSGITASPNKGNVVITNTGVTSLIQGNGISLSGSTGNITVAFSGSTYVLPLAADGTRGGVQIGYTENAKNYPVELASEKMYVNVPWTDTQNPVITASQGLTKTSNNITLDIADPDTGWAILGGGDGATTSIIGAFARDSATGNKNFGITNFIESASITSANNNVAMGFDSMGTTISTASNNVVLGSSAGNSMTTATQNTIVGGTSGQGLTTGQENTIIGDTAASALTTGTRNTIMGSGAEAGSGANTEFATAIGRGSTATTQSTAIGSGASVTGATGTALGNDASVTATNGIAIGMNCVITDAVLGLASASNPIQTVPSLSGAAIDKYLTVFVNGQTRYIALYTGNP